MLLFEILRYGLIKDKDWIRSLIFTFLNNFLKKSVFNIFDNNLMSLLHVLTGKCLNFSKTFHFWLLSDVFTSKYCCKVRLETYGLPCKHASLMNHWINHSLRVGKLYRNQNRLSGSMTKQFWKIVHRWSWILCWLY